MHEVIHTWKFTMEEEQFVEYREFHPHLEAAMRMNRGQTLR